MDPGFHSIIKMHNLLQSTSVFDLLAKSLFVHNAGIRPLIRADCRGFDLLNVAEIIHHRILLILGQVTLTE